MYKGKFCGGGKERRVIWKFRAHTGYFGGTHNGRIHTSWFGELWCLRAKDIVVCWASLFLSLLCNFCLSRTSVVDAVAHRKKVGSEEERKAVNILWYSVFLLLFSITLPPPPPPLLPRFFGLLLKGERFSHEEEAFCGAMAFSGTQQKCKACEKTVYLVEQLTADGVIYHKSCFRCNHCKGTLKVSRWFPKLRYF